MINASFKQGLVIGIISVTSAFIIPACSQQKVSQDAPVVEQVTSEMATKENVNIESTKVNLTTQVDPECKMELNECSSASECCDDMVCEKVGAYPNKVCLVK